MQLTGKISGDRTNVPLLLMLLWIFQICNVGRAQLEGSGNAQLSITPTIRKCCKENEIVVEFGVGNRTCRLRSDYITEDKYYSSWEPQFYRYPELEATRGPKSIDTKVGIPLCNGPNEKQLDLHEVDPLKDDSFRLLLNGSLSYKGDFRDFHRSRLALVESYISGKKEESIENADNENVLTEKTCDTNTTKNNNRLIYSPEKYCIDHMVIDYKQMNRTFPQPLSTDGIFVEFAIICYHHEVDIVEAYLYPSCISVSILCLIMTFLLYSVLPQLRDLTGKFILGICGFSVAAFSLTLIDIFGAADENVHGLTTEFLLHTSIVGLWICLNCMGHHVWQIIRSKSVFTRISDGKRLRYYSLYILILTTVITSVAVCVHFFVEVEDNEEDCKGNNRYKIGWSTLAAFYVPVILVLLVNIYFYWTSQRTMAKQLGYNRNMQHFQVNFDLYTKFLVVVGIWWLFHSLSLLRLSALSYIAMIFNILHGPLVFLVAMCRTRVSFLFKRYFCIDECWCCCCKGGQFAEQEFIEEECQELATIDMLKERCEENGDPMPETKRIPNGILNGTLGRYTDADQELSVSLFNVKSKREPGDVLPPADPEAPIGRVKRLLKSNSLTALANINFGWRKETSV